MQEFFSPVLTLVYLSKCNQLKFFSTALQHSLEDDALYALPSVHISPPTACHPVECPGPPPPASMELHPPGPVTKTGSPWGWRSMSGSRSVGGTGGGGLALVGDWQGLGGHMSTGPITVADRPA